ncbi:hypothetical protein MNL76_09420 [Fervidobacterium riparium]|uniref:hypothetical protein n=1 Tax=Fervidobacterium gondwanense TaxID=44754 RepID=UPI003C772428
MQRYVKDFVKYSLGIWIRAIVSFITIPITTYLIAPDEFGKAAMFSLVSIIAKVVSTLGLDKAS